MKLFAVCISVLCFGLSVAKVIPECTISGWSDWGVCVSDVQCQKPAIEPYSFKVPNHGPGYDRGRAMMERGMKLKTEAWDALDACLKDGSCPQNAQRDSIIGQTVPCVDGMAGEYPCDKADLSSFLNFDDLRCGQSGGSMRGNDIWGWTDPQTNEEYAIVGINAGTSFVKITDPVNPVVLGYLDGVGSPSSWRDIAVVNDHAYIGSEAGGHGLQVVDLNRLRTMEGCNPDMQVDYHYTEIGNSHNVVGHQASQHVYVVGATWGNYPNHCNGGLHIVDVSSPKEPRFVGCWSFDGYVHDAECVMYNGPDEEHVGQEICFCYNEDSFTIVDITDKNNLNSGQELSRTDYVNAAYTHQGAISMDHRVVLLDDEQDEFFTRYTQTYVWDVSDLDNPLHVNTFVSSETAIDHNMYIRDSLVYQSNYEAGLRILDLNGIFLQEVAYFDCHPQSTTVNFDGTWSNYPFFNSGVVAVDSIDFGLFLVMPKYEEINSAINESKIAKAKGHQFRTATAKEQDTCPIVKESRECKASPDC